MKRFDYQIQDDLGIHARPAGLLVKTAMKYPCKATLTKGQNTADMRKLFSVMKMGVRCGDLVTVICEGDHEEEALAEFGKIFAENL